MDPYRVLGLDPGASLAEVKRAYRRLAKALHPDAAGEAALPRFLELQDAYELLTGTRVRTVRPPGTAAGATPGPAGSSTGVGGAEGFREPWRADPARARAAREQARSRRAWPGGSPGSGSARAGWSAAGSGAAPPGGPGAGTSDSGSRRSRSGPARASVTGDEAAQDTSGSGSRAGVRGSGRRRASRKATLGSTSYDEAREPADRRWMGASWYGPTTGEYWHINPREYADPRKHGPGYSSRGRGEPAAGPATSTAPAGPGERARGTASSPGPSDGRSEMGRAARAAGDEVQGTVGGPPGVVGPRGVAGPPGVVGRPDAGAHGLDARADPTGSAMADRSRRLALVALAWPPLGLAAASAIGQATGCSSFAASCDGTDRLLPWLAQVLLLGLLFASPGLARVLGAGTIAALVALVPGVGILTALGGASSAEGGPVLAGWLALAWLVGVALGARRALLRSSALGSSGIP